MAAAATLTDVPGVAPYPTSPLGLHHYYKEYEGFDTLSRKFQSSELFTPFQVPQRPTVSSSRYVNIKFKIFLSIITLKLIIKTQFLPSVWD